MAVDKTELQIKAAEKRLDSMERSIESLRKGANSNDSTAQLKADTVAQLKTLSSRVDSLAASVKELNVQMVLKKDLKTETKLQADDWDREAKARQIRADAEWKARADKDAAAQKAQIDKQDAANKALIDKMVSEATLNNRFTRIEAEFGVRIKTLEAQVAVALAKR